MSVLQDVFGHHINSWKNTSSDKLISDSYVGIEVELELMSGVSPDLKCWNLVQEGSLRNAGKEFNFKEPLFGEDVVDALDELEERVVEKIEHLRRHMSVTEEMILDDNTSVHAHIDVRNLDDDQLSNFILYGIAFDQLLFSYAAPERENNIFSLSMAKANSEARGVGALIAALSGDKNHSDIYSFVEGASKYSSINLSSIRNFGSIEFRAHRGEYRAEPILKWINILLCLKEAAINKLYKPADLVEALQSMPSVVIKRVFGEYADDLTSRRMGRDLMTGAKLLAELLYVRNTTQRRNLDISSPKEGSLLYEYEDFDELFPDAKEVAEDLEATVSTQDADELVRFFTTSNPWVASDSVDDRIAIEEVVGTFHEEIE